MEHAGQALGVGRWPSYISSQKWATCPPNPAKSLRLWPVSFLLAPTLHVIAQALMEQIFALLAGIPPGTLVFGLISMLIVGGALIVTFSQNILYSAFALLACFAGVAGLFFYLSAGLVAAIQLVVYVGGINVLILFAVMLTEKIKDLGKTNLLLDLRMALPLGLLVFGFMTYVIWTTPWPITTPFAAPVTEKLGNAFLTEYLLPFEIASIVLLAVLIGAVVIARREVRQDYAEKAGRPFEEQP